MSLAFHGESLQARFMLRWVRRHASYLVVLLLCLAELPAQTTTNSSRWEQEIAAFEASDPTNPPPRNGIVFIGSSSFRLWKTLAQDFPGKAVINRGFGGSEIADCTAFASRIIFPYHPKMIVLYAGDNDLAGGKSPEQVISDYHAFVRTVRGQLPETRIAFLSIKPSPSRWRLKEQICQVNREVAATKEKGLLFIDIYSQMLGLDGNPRSDLFMPDALHPNAEAYHLWASLIEPFFN